jgi:hypothetical protein
MLPHRFVDVFETVSIIGDFYVRAIRRTARLPRQTMLLTHMAPPSPTARLSLEKKLEYFLPPFTCGDTNPSSIWSGIGQVAADTVGVDSQNR